MYFSHSYSKRSKNAASINSIIQIAGRNLHLDLLGPRQIRQLSQVAMRSKGHSSWSSTVPRIFTLLPSLWVLFASTSILHEHQKNPKYLKTIFKLQLNDQRYGLRMHFPNTRVLGFAASVLSRWTLTCWEHSPPTWRSKYSPVRSSVAARRYNLS